MSTFPEILHTRDARGVHRLTLNRPAAFNTLSESMLAHLRTLLAEVAADGQARAVVLAAEGKAFCAGHDLKQMRANPHRAYYEHLFEQCNRVMLAIRDLPVPVIARVQGLATAAGCQLVAQCDLAVAAEGCRFGVNGIDAGLFCSTPSVPLARNVPAKTAMEMLLTGHFISAPEALARGLLNRVTAPEALDDCVEQLVAAIAARPRQAIALGKQLFYAQRELGVAAAYQLAAQTMAANLMLDTAQEGMQAFIEKRKPAWAQ
ncbi:MAG: enoyl-CoA hydratase [Burkholderiaceae bacterium]|jgi:enoyl-CoA hydratase/carnithine racemase|nr:enoyl-CoA hydratase [Burkholderiaceae bacterium]